MPLWNGRYRVVYRAGMLMWSWEVWDNTMSARLRWRGRSWTYGSAIWAAERAAGA
jgi:hypothetical protein